MKLTWPWRRPQPAEPEQRKPRKDDGPPINIRVPREAVCRSVAAQPSPCPRSGGELRQSYQTHLIATRRGSAPSMTRAGRLAAHQGSARVDGYTD